MHRIRDVMRRLRLGAPSLTDRGPRLDPNTVAEYLDNTLPSEQVTDFEKVCLDSDVHLGGGGFLSSDSDIGAGRAGGDRRGRAGSGCINSRTPRQRLQPAASPAVVAPPLAPGHSVPPPLRAEAPGDAALRKHRPKPTVPEYLREGQRKRRWVPITLLAILIVCVTGVVLHVFGQLEPRTPVGDWLIRWGIRKAPQEVAAKPVTTPTEKAAAKRKSRRPRKSDKGPARESVQQENGPPKKRQ